MTVQINSAIHPKTGEVYNVGDKVLIYQGRFGHNNIIQIVSMWQNEHDIYVSETDKLPGTYLSAVKNKVTDKFIKEIRKIKAQYQQFENYQINL